MAAKLNFEARKLEIEKREALKARELDLEDRRLKLEEKKMAMMEQGAWPPVHRPPIAPMEAPNAIRVPWEEL